MGEVAEYEILLPCLPPTRTFTLVRGSASLHDCFAFHSSLRPFTTITFVLINFSPRSTLTGAIVMHGAKACTSPSHRHTVQGLLMFQFQITLNATCVLCYMQLLSQIYTRIFDIFFIWINELKVIFA